MATFKWATPGNASVKLSTELNSLASGALSSGSAVIDNASGLFLYMTAELLLASGPGWAGTPYVPLYMQKSIDGTSFEDLSTAAVHSVIGVFPIGTAAGTAKRAVLSNILIPPVAFKLAVENKLSTAFAAAGNTLSIKRYNEQST